MRAIMVMFDSLNRGYLEPYGGTLVSTPNFRRLAEQSVCFDSHYANSLPCMPARRELHTGRYNFLHRSWGPLEPFDDSMPELLKKAGIYTHLVSDHRHYWEDGGSTYHNRYSSWEVSRGQEGDPWKGLVDFETEKPSEDFGCGDNPLVLLRPHSRWDQVNRRFINKIEDMPQVKTFDMGLSFIDDNHQADRWFLQIETFDPHEPFYIPGEEDEALDWPPYYPVRESVDIVERVRRRYGRLLRLCDAQLGRVLDRMDAYGMWEDTMLIVNTDHGFLLGEHGWWGKSIMPLYQELVHTPLFLYDPRSRMQGERRSALTQNIDLAPTLLEFFGLSRPEAMRGKPLRPVLEENAAQHAYALFGIHGGSVNITDGQYVYMLPPAAADNQPLYEYTLMPAHMASMFSREELHTLETVPGRDWSNHVPVLRIRKPTRNAPGCSWRFGIKLFDLRTDPGQINELTDEAEERRMLELLLRALAENDCPEEQYERLGLSLGDKLLSDAEYRSWAERRNASMMPPVCAEADWSAAAAATYWVIAELFPYAVTEINAYLTAAAAKNRRITQRDLEDAIRLAVDEKDYFEAVYYTRLNGRTC